MLYEIFYYFRQFLNYLVFIFLDLSNIILTLNKEDYEEN
jgi:hypothetical protein